MLSKVCFYPNISELFRKREPHSLPCHERFWRAIPLQADKYWFKEYQASQRGTQWCL